MIIHDYSNSNSILQKYIAELRSETIQKDALRFRHNLERVGQILGYELSKTLRYYQEDVQTPYGIKTMHLPEEEIVVGAILRAGLPLHRGALSCFDNAENLFISAFRKHLKDGSIKTVTEYLAAPDLKDKTLLLCDPMIATGITLETTYDVIKKKSPPKQVHILAVIASQDGVEHIDKCFPKDTHLWIATIDTTLSDRKYIIPGLGDAGDLSFGVKQ